MSLFKKIFGSKKSNDDIKLEPESQNSLPETNASPSLPKYRLDTMEVCLTAGYKPANWLPFDFDRQLRPSIEIANRLHAIKALVLWLLVPQENLPNETLLSFIRRNQLEDSMTEHEKEILKSSRDSEDLRNSIGWKFENAWPLAWYFGYLEPEITGQMMTGEQMQEILMNYTCKLDDNVENWIKAQKTISLEEVTIKEDLFYCLHNAVRSAQLGGDTVPPNFNPMLNGGVIHERRHSLTWMLSKGTNWDDTDLST